MKLVIMSIFLLSFAGCALPLLYYGGESDDKGDKVSTFSNNTVGSFKEKVDEGWKISVQNNKLIFIRKSETGVEIFKPIK